MIGFNPEEDRRRHTVSEGGVVVVAAGRRAVCRRRSARRRCSWKPKRIGADDDRQSTEHGAARCAVPSVMHRVMLRAFGPPWLFVNATMKIIDVRGREILDSRGNPTVEVEVTLDGGARGRAGGAVGRVDRRARSARAARRRQVALSGQGRSKGRRPTSTARSRRRSRARSSRSVSSTRR